MFSIQYNARATSYSYLYFCNWSNAAVKGLIVINTHRCRWVSGQVVRALDCCAKHRWFEPNPQIMVGMFARCSPGSKWVPGGNTGEVKGGEERNWLPYLTMPAAQDKCPSNRHSLNVRNCTWDSPLTLPCT